MNAQMLNDILGAYGDLNCPNWSFVLQRYAKNPYQNEVAQIREFAQIEDGMDYNSDYAAVYSVSSDLEQLFIRISLVGRYACVSDINGKVLSVSELKSHDLGRKILDIVRNSNIEVMDNDQLREKVVFNNQKTLLYEVLFSADNLVWE